MSKIRPKVPRSFGISSEVRAQVFSRNPVGDTFFNTGENGQPVQVQRGRGQPYSLKSEIIVANDVKATMLGKIVYWIVTQQLSTPFQWIKMTHGSGSVEQVTTNTLVRSSTTKPPYVTAIASYENNTGGTLVFTKVELEAKNRTIPGTVDVYADHTFSVTVLDTEILVITWYERFNQASTELAEALHTPHWTLGAGWSYLTSPDRLSKDSDGTGTVTPAVATSIEALKTYRVVITVDSVSASTATYTLGGVAGTALAAATTYVDYITTATTGDLIITPVATGLRMVISAISIQAMDFSWVFYDNLAYCFKSPGTTSIAKKIDLLQASPPVRLSGNTLNSGGESDDTATFTAEVENITVSSVTIDHITLVFDFVSIPGEPSLNTVGWLMKVDPTVTIAAGEKKPVKVEMVFAAYTP